MRDIGSYDIVFVGSPNWWGTVATPVKTFLSMQDFTVKIVIPFCTHGGGGCTRLFSDITKKAVETKLPGLEIYGGRVESSKEEVIKWLKNSIYRISAVGAIVFEIGSCLQNSFYMILKPKEARINY